MIKNAVINSYQVPGVADGNGGLTPAGDPIAYAFTCAFDAPTRAQIYTLGSKIADASGVLYLGLGDVVRPVPGGIFTVTLRSPAGMPAQPARRVQVITVVDRVHAGLSHYEAYVKDA